MTISDFDIHSFVKRLHHVGFTNQQAETQSDLVRWIVGTDLIQTALITALLLKLSTSL